MGIIPRPRNAAELYRALDRAGLPVHVQGDVVTFRTDQGEKVCVAFLAEPTTYDRIGPDGRIIGEYTVPAGWRAYQEVLGRGVRLCEGATWDELFAAIGHWIPVPTPPEPGPFDGPFGAKGAEDISEDIRDVQEVFDGENLLGETGWNDAPARNGFFARTAQYATRGDMPGQLTGWAGRWPTRRAAENALRQHAKRTT